MSNQNSLATTTISVIIETFSAVHESTDTKEEQEKITELMRRLQQQTYPLELVEIVLVLPAQATELIAFAQQTYPQAKVALSKYLTQSAMKNRGLEAATGDILAFTDADCLPCFDWLERIARTILNGADVAVGKTRYHKHYLFAKAFSSIDFGHVQAMEAGQASGFVANNVAFRKSVLSNLRFQEKIGRYGSCYYLAQQLKAGGFIMKYDPGQFALHEFDVARFDIFLKHYRRGFDNMNIFRLDSDKVMPGTQFLHLGILAPIAMAASRMLFDFKRFITNRVDLEISLPQLPFLYFLSITLRTTEMIGGIIAFLSPLPQTASMVLLLCLSLFSMFRD